MSKPTIELSIRRISPAQTVRMRHRILWPSIPIEEQLLPYDLQDTTVHLGAFLIPSQEPDDMEGRRPPGLDEGYFAVSSEDDKAWPVGNLTITHEGFPRPEILAPELGMLEGRQVHKFAVHEALQGHGIGSRLFHAAVACVQDSLDGAPTGHPGLLLHLDTRAEAATFYQRLGMHVVDDETFVKRGPNGLGPPVSYIRMGLHVRPHGGE